MQEKVSLYSYITLGVLVLLGILLVVALISFLMQGVSQLPLAGDSLIKLLTEDPLYPIGAFFFTAFQWAAFLIPLFLFTNAFLLLIRPFPRLFLLFINLLLIPFLTLTLAIRMLTAGSADELPPLAMWIKGQFGQLGGTVLVFLLFILELVVIYQVFNFLWGKLKRDKRTGSQARHYSRMMRDAWPKRNPQDSASWSSKRSARPGGLHSRAASEARDQAPNAWPKPERNNSLRPSASYGESSNPQANAQMQDEKQKRRDTNNYAFSSGGAPNIFIPNDPRLKAFPQPSSKPAANKPEATPPVRPQPGIAKKPAEPSTSRSRPALPQQPIYPPVPQQEKTGLPISANKLPAPAEEELDLSAFSKQGGIIEDAVYEHVQFEPQAQTMEPFVEEIDPESEPEVEADEAEAEPEGEAEIEVEANLPIQAPVRMETKPIEGASEHILVRKRSNFRHYTVPENLLKEYKDGEYWKIDKDTGRAGEILMNTLLEFNITAELTGICKGPVITMFELLPSPGVKLSKIVNLADNIALRLAASSVRIVAPIPGKHAVGIEIPNKKRATVSFKELISLPVFKKNKYEIPVVLGKDIAGEAQIIDLVHTPHLLIAGATGSGKSVCVNSLIASILFKKTPDEVRLLLIDPKIVELKFFNDIPHLLTPVITESKRSFQALQYCLCEMERRYSLLDSVGVRDIASYNRKIKEKKLATTSLPYIVIVIDEFADLMATTGKELESTIARLTAMSRAVGIHLVLATQRPSVDVITGLIKANIPSRIAFMVASKFDSRIIIDGIGAEKLLGKGDMLFTSAWNPFPVRIQGSFLTEEEVEAITDYVKTLGEPDYIDDEIFYEDEEDSDYVPDGEADPLLEEAIEIILSANKASTSYLQRKLKIGYNRAARLIEDMEHRGIVGPPNGSKAREIIHVPDRK